MNKFVPLNFALAITQTLVNIWKKQTLYLPLALVT